MAIWSGQVLSQAQVGSLWRRGANRVSFQVRTCVRAGCADNPSWRGPDGTANSYFSELNNVDAAGNVLATGPSLSFASFPSLALPTGRYFQYRAVLESDDVNSRCTYAGAPAPCSPQIDSVSSSLTVPYDTSSPTVQNLAALAQPYHTLTSFSAAVSGSCPGGITFNLSPDGSTWYWYNGSSWAVASGGVAQSNTAASLTGPAMQAFAPAAGVGNTYFRAFLSSDGSQPCGLASVQIGGTL